MHQNKHLYSGHDGQYERPCDAATSRPARRYIRTDSSQHETPPAAKHYTLSSTTRSSFRGTSTRARHCGPTQSSASQAHCVLPSVELHLVRLLHPSSSWPHPHLSSPSPSEKSLLHHSALAPSCLPMTSRAEGRFAGKTPVQQQFGSRHTFADEVVSACPWFLLVVVCRRQSHVCGSASVRCDMVLRDEGLLMLTHTSPEL